MLRNAQKATLEMTRQENVRNAKKVVHTAQMLILALNVFLNITSIEENASSHVLLKQPQRTDNALNVIKAAVLNVLLMNQMFVS